MVFKIVRAGMKLRRVERSLGSDRELERYAGLAGGSAGRHPLHEDIEILKKEFDWLRFSAPANLGTRELNSSLEAAGSAGNPGAASTIDRIGDILHDPGAWAGKAVRIEGRLEHFVNGRNGERWHVITDGTGALAALGARAVAGGSGVLDGTVSRTPSGRNVFVEIREFRAAP